MRLNPRRGLLAAVAVAACSTFALGTAPASADHCEPTEPVVRVIRPTYEEPGAESDNPLCYVLLNYVYPRVCDNPLTLLGTCLNSINPDPNEPVVVYPYKPVPGRMYCNYVNFVYRTANQSSTCTY